MIVIDTSVVVESLIGGSRAVGLHRVLLGEDLHAPTLIDYEVVSSLRGWARSGRVSTARVAEALNDFASVPIERWQSSEDLRRRAFQLRDVLTAYDAAYVALAEGLDCAIFTRDRRLAASTGHQARIRLV